MIIQQEDNYDYAGFVVGVPDNIQNLICNLSCFLDGARMRILMISGIHEKTVKLSNFHLSHLGCCVWAGAASGTKCHTREEKRAGHCANPHQTFSNNPSMFNAALKGFPCMSASLSLSLSLSVSRYTYIYRSNACNYGKYTLQNGGTLSIQCLTQAILNFQQWAFSAAVLENSTCKEFEEKVPILLPAHGPKLRATLCPEILD